MREIFVLEDILNALISLEEYGNELYMNLSEEAKDLETRKLFITLADQEMKHKKIYQGFKSELTFHEEVEDDYRDYLSHLVKSNIKLSHTQIKSYSHGEALDIGIGLEKDTILFLNELKGVVDGHGLTIDALIGEEKKHLRILLGLKGD